MRIFLGEQAPTDNYDMVCIRENLDNICDDNECIEINAPEMLNFIPKDKHGEFISHLVSKLRHNGKLIVGGTDIISLSLAVFNKSMSIEDANKVLYSEKNKGITCLEEIRAILLNSIKITKQIPGIHFFIEGYRP